MAALFIALLVEKCAACQSHWKSDFGWHRFKNWAYSLALVRGVRGLKSIKRFWPPPSLLHHHHHISIVFFSHHHHISIFSPSVTTTAFLLFTSSTTSTTLLFFPFKSFYKRPYITTVSSVCSNVSSCQEQPWFSPTVSCLFSSSAPVSLTDSHSTTTTCIVQV